MKNLKKVLSLALVLLLALTLSVSAFAGEISIENAKNGETYTAYKIFDYTSSGANYSYTIASDSAWKTIVDNYKNAAEKDVFTLTASASDAARLVVTINDGIDFTTDEEAAHFAAYLAANIPAEAPKTTVQADASGAKFTGLDAGYYFVDTSLGSLCALYNNNSEQTVSEKNTQPTLEKKIVVNSEDVDATTASIGDTVHYKITVTNGKGTDSSITVHDSMEAGLTLNDDLSVKADNADVAPEHYTVNKTGSETFTIAFSADYVKTLAEGAKIVITYSAKLNKRAEISAEANDNTAWLTYSAQESAHDTVSVAAYQFELVKTTSDKTVLDGAKFKLYNALTGGMEIKVVKVADGQYRLAEADETGVLIEAGKAVVQGLGNGTYYLEETDAPNGYNLLTARQPVTISGSNLAAEMAADGKYESGGIQVINLTGTELPSTGGIGTTIFYALGGLLAVGAAVVLVTRKRVHDTEA